jgi:signal transduction histidine kinase
MAALIENLLMLARVTQSDVKFDHVDLSSVARSSAGRLQRAQPERAIEVVIAEGLVVRGDGRLLGIVFDNLLGNSWKFTTSSATTVPAST